MLLILVSFWLNFSELPQVVSLTDHQKLISYMVNIPSVHNTETIKPSCLLKNVILKHEY